MHVCLISPEYPPDTGPGGVGTYTRHLAHGLCGAGHRVTIVSDSIGPDCQQADGPVRVIRLARPSVAHLRLLQPYYYLRRIAHTVAHLERVEGLDVVEAPLWDGPSLLVRPDHAPVVVRLITPVVKVDEIEPNRRSRRALMRLRWTEQHAALRADLCLAISRSIGDLIHKHYRVPMSRIRLARLGLPLPASTRAEARSGSQAVHILFVGRHEPRKGTAVLLRAMVRVLAECPTAILELAGNDFAVDASGQTHQQLAHALIPMEQRHRVSFLGRVSDEERDRLYQRCSIFVAPSIYESYGLVYLEAMGYGKPVIGCRVGGVPEVVQDGINGLLVPPGDPGSLADALVRLVKDAALRRRMGEAARRRAEELGVPMMVEEAVAAYQAARELRTARGR